MGRIINFFKGFSTVLITTAFKCLKSINHIPFSQHPVVVLLPCSSDENWDGEIQLKGSNTGCSLWEVYYLEFFQYTKLYAALYVSEAWLQLISLTDLHAQYICKSNLRLKRQSVKEGYKINDNLEQVWFKTLSSTDQELWGKAALHLILSRTLTVTSSFCSLQSLLRLSHSFQFLQPKGQRSSGQTAFYITSNI